MPLFIESLRLHGSKFVLVATLGLWPVLSLAQSLPPQSRTVFKCTVNKKVVYTDEPCVGAEKVNVEPTRGMNKSSGRELTGTDVARERRNEQFAEAVKPITGMSSKQFETAKLRTKLSPEAKSECANLDRGIEGLESQDRQAEGENKANIQRSLFASRKRYRELRC